MDENEGSIPPVECLPGLFGGRDAGDCAGIKTPFGSTGVRGVLFFMPVECPPGSLA
jgi:hypothetical protein